MLPDQIILLTKGSVCSDFKQQILSATISKEIQFEIIQGLIFFFKWRVCTLMTYKHAVVNHAGVKESSRSFRGLTTSKAFRLEIRGVQIVFVK